MRWTAVNSGNLHASTDTLNTEQTNSNIQDIQPTIINANNIISRQSYAQADKEIAIQMMQTKDNPFKLLL